jgi:hypothetical protein
MPESVIGVCVLNRPPHPFQLQRPVESRNVVHSPAQAAVVEVEPERLTSQSTEVLEMDIAVTGTVDRRYERQRLQGRSDFGRDSIEERKCVAVLKENLVNCAERLFD